MRTYIWEREGWPAFTWDANSLAAPLQDARYAQGYLAGRLKSLATDFRAEAGVEAMTEEIVRSSQIEGEKLNVAGVRSSIARRLGLDAPKPQRREAALGELMLDVTQGYRKPLTKARLCNLASAAVR